MKFVIALGFAIFCAWLGFQFTLRKTFVNPYPLVCDLVAEKIYLPDTEVTPWKRQCLQRARLVDASSNYKLIIQDLNNMMDLLKVSHLQVFAPELVTQYWKGESLETGIESEFVDGELVIFKVHPQSPADQAQIKRGDVIVSMDDQQPNPWESRSQSGVYLLRRLDKEFRVDLKAAKILRDEKMNFVKISPGKGQLIVPSFRAEFFQDEVVKKIIAEVSSVQHVVVDVRGNAGGNFVAGLRLLSMFICQPTVVGDLTKPRAKQKNETTLPDDLRDMEQLALLNVHSTVHLKTFPTTNCFKGKVSVLVDGKSASVAELVAQALKEKAKATILGSPSGGELLMGVWYPVDEITKGAEVSIPEAVYTSQQGHVIEGQGVMLDRLIYYNLREMQLGIDSWVRQALDLKPK